MTKQSVFHKLTGTINGVCLLNVLLGIGIIGAISTASSYGYENAVGWIAVMGASVIFGSTGIPFKAESLGSISLDPIIFAFYSSFGIFLVSLPLSLFLWWKLHEFEFQPWSILGSFDILVTTFLAFQTVQQVGYAKGPAIWATVGMVFSFVIGAVAFQETITNMIAAVFSIPSLITGMLLIISCQPSEKETTKEYSTVPATDEGEIELKGVTVTNGSSPTDENTGHVIINSNETSVPSKGNILRGVVLGVFTGIVDGSLMVPFKITKSSTAIETYQYLASFGFSSLITTPIIFILYYFYLSMRKPPPNDNNKNKTEIHNNTISMDQMRLSMIPGVLNGILWGLANFMSVTATYHLSMRIAFPLTQTCVLFATCWGIFYFHEIEKTKETLSKLVAGLGFFLLGTFLLAVSSD